MLNKKHKLIELKTKTLVDSLFVWNYKTKHKWRWIEFISYKEYDFSDDVKNIDFIKSSKEWKTLVKLYEEEKELSVYFVISLNDSFFSDNFSTKKIDMLLELFYLVWLSAIKSWDKLWSFIFDDFKNKLCFAKKWKQNFINIVNEIDTFAEEKIKKQNLLEKLKNSFNKEDKKILENNWLKYFNSLKIKNSLVFYVTDKSDIELKELRVLSTKNDLIVCNLFNHFENFLDWKWVSWLQNDWEKLFVDLDSKKRQKYIQLRKEKLKNFRNKVIKNNASYLFIDETKNIYKEVSKLFNN